RPTTQSEPRRRPICHSRPPLSVSLDSRCRPAQGASARGRPSAVYPYSSAASIYGTRLTRTDAATSRPTTAESAQEVGMDRAATTERETGRAGALAVDGGTPVRSAPMPRRTLIGEEEKRAVLALFDREM